MTGSDYNKVFSDYIINRMEAQKLNQSEVSRLTGIRQDKISRIVNGHSRIALPDFVKLMEVLSPDFTKQMLKNVGKNLNIMLTSGLQKSVESDKFVSKSHLAWLMLNSQCDSLYQLSPTPPHIQNFKKNYSTRNCRNDRSISLLCFFDGVGAQNTITKNINKIVRDFQMEYRMDQKLYFTGSC